MLSSCKCPVCGGGVFPFYSYRDFFGEVVSMVKCINCGHGSHAKEYSESEFSEIYRQNYAAGYIQEEDALRTLRLEQYQLDASHLTSLCSKDDLSVFDFGCSSGDFLDAMPSSWEKSGFEVNPFHLDFVSSSKPYIRIYSDLAKIDGVFDVIVFRGVVEHIQDPQRVVDFVRKHLVVGGAVYICATPDFSSPCSVLYKENWNQVVCPEHIHQYSLASISLLLAKAGLALKDVAYPYLGTPYENWPVDSCSFLAAANMGEGVQRENSGYKHAFPGNMMSAFFERRQA